MVYFLVWRTVKVRYKQTALGIIWVVGQPVLSALLLTLVFSRFVGISSGNLPYPVFALAGLVPWNYFAGTLTHGSNSLIGNATLISKVYFPRLVIPLSSLAAGLLDLGIGCSVLLAFVVVFRVPFHASLLTLPLWGAFAAAATLGPTLWLSALNVRYRDVAQALPFLIQLLMLASPVFYPVALVPARWRTLYALNPMATIVEGFRSAIEGVGTVDRAMVATSAVVTLFLVVTGVMFFRHMERTFADVV